MFHIEIFPERKECLMKGLLKLLFEEQTRLETIIIKVKNRLKDAPTGTLRLSRSHYQLQYYRCTKEKKTGIYINKNDIEIARQLAQKTYDEKCLGWQKKYLRIIFIGMESSINMNVHYI